MDLSLFIFRLYVWITCILVLAVVLLTVGLIRSSKDSLVKLEMPSEWADFVPERCIGGLLGRSCRPIKVILMWSKGGVSSVREAPARAPGLRGHLWGPSIATNED